MAFRNKVYCDDLEEVNACIETCSNQVCHVMKADENKWNSLYVVVAHIVCEYCSLCETQGDVRGLKLDTIPDYQEVEWEE